MPAPRPCDPRFTTKGSRLNSVLLWNPVGAWKTGNSYYRSPVQAAPLLRINAIVQPQNRTIVGKAQAVRQTQSKARATNLQYVGGCAQ